MLGIADVVDDGCDAAHRFDTDDAFQRQVGLEL